ncbi:methylated-DNA-[protein]-cysteine S-methyltransferase [Desulfobaculum xiamenense]|uniref:Methylated-DNA--protein-cysteine methyltransferase n=1 Tax=Desulfobaculum xiamenense TaxID=995050 RepID=A0A846QH80_9BACT|nr:methylated-DNA--[protein]-cysteine S-methyltransferase [Desulfobaculum xiamenense]NJB68176.1 methylated-DNA-[protein]-cysteine S-methyltransferase [Desulfobaculum xiamenense]
MRTRRTECIAAGPLALDLHWDNGVLLRTELSARGERTPSPQLTDAGALLQQALSAYVNGEDVAWPRIPYAMHGLSPFTRTVLVTLRDTVGRGETVTYAELAARAGSPRAARAVGRAMATNRWPLLIPCHRVLAAGGLGGYSLGLDLKRLLLTIEGVALPG